MYLLAHSSIVIACPQQRAFDYAADLENFPQWFPGVLEITADDALPVATPGKQYRETVVVPMRGRQSVLIRVTESSRPHRLVTEGSLAVLRPRMEIGVECLGADVCRVSWRMASRNVRGWARFVVLPVARRVLTTRAEIGLRRLKGCLEVK